ncbi:MAG: DUF1232 domain-containing protein [Chloroflexota bacterium]|nr:MAG: DUF1232 domain-containing protein [Chloroflexota bacterium]
MDGRGGTQPDGARDLPDGRWIAASTERRGDVIEDLRLAAGVVPGHGTSWERTRKDHTEHPFDVKCPRAWRLAGSASLEHRRAGHAEPLARSRRPRGLRGGLVDFPFPASVRHGRCRGNGIRGSEAPRRMTRKERQGSRATSASRGRSTGGGMRRMLGLLAMLPLASRAPLYARLVWALLLDDRTPAARKATLAAALGYVLLGRDLIPDDVPVLGGLDDIVVVAIAIDVFLDGIDEDVINEKLDELEIDRVAFHEDVARIRRFLPAPVRRVVRRLPGLVQTAGEALQQSGLGPRLRGWITREESNA